MKKITINTLNPANLAEKTKKRRKAIADLQAKYAPKLIAIRDGVKVFELRDVSGQDDRWTLYANKFDEDGVRVRE